MLFGEYIEFRRSELGLNKKELAALIKCRRATLDEWIAGATFPRSAEHQVNLATALKCSPLYLQRLWYAGQGHHSAPPLKPRYQGDRASFVEDLTIEDNTTVLAGESFYKKWRIQNTGSLIWKGRTLTCVDNYGEQQSQALIEKLLIPVRRTVSIPTTAIGSTVDIEVELTAPLIPTTVISEWKIADKEGNLCFERYPAIYCLVRVVLG